MAIKTFIVTVCVLSSFINVYYVVSEFLDIEELRNINYGIDIVNEPVKITSEETQQLDNTLYMKSKYGQQYQCSFPNQVEQDRQKEAAEKSALEIGIPDLLKPLEEGPCLFKAKDWWSYEFCYGKYIRQFHAEDGKITGEIIYLGHFESEFDWNNETNQEISNENRLNRYHSQRYVNGSKCDLTGKPRTTEVRFLCEEGSGDYIARIDEPGTCSYVMNIHTTKICHHPYLKPPTKTKPIQITCSPLLTDTQYEEYLQQIEEEKRLKEIEEQKALAEEKRLEELAELEKQKEVEAAKVAEAGETEDDVSVDVEGEEDVTLTSSKKLPSVEDLIKNSDINTQKIFGSGLNKALQKELRKLMKDMPASQKMGADSNMKVKVISSMDDLKNVLKDVMDETKNIKSPKPVSEKPDSPVTPMEEDTSEVKGDTSKVKGDTPEVKVETSKVKVKVGDEDVQDDQSIDTEGENLKFEPTKSDKTSDKSFGIDWKKFSMRRMTDAITALEEKSKLLLELFTQYKEPDPDLMFDVKRLRQKYLETIGEVKEIKAEFLDKLLSMDLENAEDLRDFKETADIYEEKYDAVIEKLEGVTSETEDMIGVLYGLLSLENKAQQEDKDQNEEDTDVKGPKKTDKSLKDKVKVTLTKIGHKDVSEIKNAKNSVQMEQLEKEVQESLEEAGLNLGDGKIQVKIITAGYFDDKEEKLHMLSDEDTKSFKNMIVSILGGENEAAKEQQRHSQLEDNYNFVWGKNDKKSKDI